MKRILITGVAGFIGSNLAERLLAERLRVEGIDDLSHGFRRNDSWTDEYRRILKLFEEALAGSGRRP